MGISDMCIPPYIARYISEREKNTRKDALMLESDEEEEKKRDEEKDIFFHGD